jgi:betaine lipid synthase
MPFPEFFSIVREPLVQVGLVGIALLAFLALIFSAAFLDPRKYSGPLVTLGAYARFAYACFFKPHTGDDTGSQQDALESFYKAQADAYDATRARLLHGREDLLSLVASQLIQRNFGSKRPIWVDVREHTLPLTQTIDSNYL